MLETKIGMAHAKGWDPPGGDMSFDALMAPPLKIFPEDRRLTSDFYRFPWYLCFMPYWHAFRHWCRTKEWPIRVLYFRDDQDREKKIYLEVRQNPSHYFSYGLTEPEGSNGQDVEFDEVFREAVSDQEAE